MKTYGKIFQINPLGRDMIILVGIGLLVAITLVTAACILINQF